MNVYDKSKTQCDPQKGTPLVQLVVVSLTNMTRQFARSKSE